MAHLFDDHEIRHEQRSPIDWAVYVDGAYAGSVTKFAYPDEAGFIASSDPFGQARETLEAAIGSIARRHLTIESPTPRLGR